VVKAGDIVKVKVLEVDVKRRRIALSMRLDEPAGPREARAAGGERGRDAPRGAGHDSTRHGGAGRGVPGREGRREPGHGSTPRRDEPRGDGIMADALKRALQRR
ncbi:MAG: S1 RNA-binding domain-containing protein, partial [Gammaproteobacteria bacterium]|nr:S1 RNA-binding domain-containing protein [Gammaproteobacteria bacterium]